MRVIYKPKGKALEYSDLAVNLMNGCRHRCKYCFAPMIFRKSLDEWSENPTVRDGVLECLEKEAKKRVGEKKSLLLSFTSDPYQSEESAEVTREALLILEKYQFKNVTVLTKGGMRAVQDFDILARNKWSFGSTISFQSDLVRGEWEENASPIGERYRAVKRAKLMNIKVWISLEPVIYLDEALKVMKDLTDFVDLWKIGKLNHVKDLHSVEDWIKFIKGVREAVPEERIFFKEGLRSIEKQAKNRGAIK